MIRLILFTILSLGLGSSSLAETKEPLCLLDPAQLPKSWRSPAELQKRLNPAPWSEAEARDAQYAKRTGMNEMIGLFKQNPSAVHKLFDDAIAALLQVTYASANKPEFDGKMRNVARTNLTALLTPYLKRNPESAECDEFEDLLPLAIFAHRLYPAKHKLTGVVTKRTNVAYRDCGSLEEATENILKKIREDNQLRSDYIDHLEDLFDLYAWTVLLIEAELYPDIELPDEARAFGQTAWEYFKTFPLPGVNAFEKGVKDEKFITLADLATHLSHIPTGLGRFPLYASDKSDLYTFLRESFYPMLRSGDRDLFALFVDTLRQYGCTPENDVQVRDGTRYLLNDFHKHNDKWMNYHEERKTFSDPIEYIQIHHVWTALLGVRDRKLEKPKPGNYGGIVRRWIPPPR